MPLTIYSLEGCPYSIKSESLLKLYNPKIIKVSQAEKDKYKKQKISPKLRIQVWRKEFNNTDEGKCPLCNKNIYINIILYFIK